MNIVNTSLFIVIESYFFFTERKDIGLNFVFHAPERMFLVIQVFDQLETDCRPCCILRQN